MSQHMHRVITFNETDQTITVQPGMLGPALERLLNHAPEEFQAGGATPAVISHSPSNIRV
jgi:alkyldihydroxyacetonephosphate synthase